MKRYRKISKQQFEYFLGKYDYVEFTEKEYEFDWEEKEPDRWTRVGLSNKIYEYCYKIKLDNNYCLKVYSSVDKRTGWTRNKKLDAIRLVPAETLSLEPIRPSFPHIKRIDSWTYNFQKRTGEILDSLGENTVCPKCGKQMVLRCNHSSRQNFIGCCDYPECKGKYDLRGIFLENN